MEEVQKKKSAHAGYKFIIFLLIIVLGGLTFWHMQSTKNWTSINEQIEAEKDSVAEKLKHMLSEYENVVSKNLVIQEEVEAEKEKVRTLLNKIHQMESSQIAEIRRYEEEANTLRTIMRHYIHQIDSLNTLSQNLLAENKVVKKDLSASREANERLTEEKESLTSQVQKGAQVRVRNINAIGLNSRDKNTERASRTKKIKTCAIVSENQIAKAGARNAYVRIISPSNELIKSAESGIIENQRGEGIEYSAKREVDYQNTDIEVCIYVDVQNTTMAKGKYSIEIYFDNILAGEGEFTLK
ncbi:MAG: hypothetical protein ACRCZB_04345 [Bacteroidales bacterium]